MTNSWIVIFRFIFCFIALIGESYSLEEKVYKVDFQMDEAARQIRLVDVGLDKLKDHKNLMVVIWDNDESFFSQIELIDQLKKKSKLKVIGIFKGTDITSLRRVKIYANMEYLESHKHLRLFLTENDQYYDIDNMAQKLKIFQGTAPRVKIFNSDGKLSTQLVNKEQIQNYIRNITNKKQTDQLK